jgi:O-antigen/teichoic acid export membrane protein
MIIARPVVVLLGGGQFQPAAIALSILIWATFFAFFNTVLYFTFNATSMQRYNFNIFVIMAGVSALLAFLLIPKYGFIGASYSLVAAECAGLIYGLILTRSFGLVFPVENLKKNLLASLVMAISIWFLPSLFLQLLLGFIIYIIVNILIKGIVKEDLFKLLSPAKMSKEILR